MLVSIIIKALNEERRIGAAIESALAALADVDGEVIVVDSCSADRTVEIASRYPVLVVELADLAERCCGVGPQLGYQYARGSYVGLIDGDMELDPHFIRPAVTFLNQHADHAAVAGHVEEANLENLEFARRVRRTPADLKAGEVDRLNGGGLFRRSAVEEVGYFTDRSLHAYEEFDLAARLRARGWRLSRIAIPFVRHHGHHTNAYRLLLRRWTTGYVLGLGEVVRASLGRPHAATVLAQPEIRLWIAVAASWATSLLALLMAPRWQIGLAVAIAVQLLPIAVMSLRYRSLQMGCYAVVAWHVNTLGFIAGLLRRRLDPTAAVRGRVRSDRRTTKHETVAG